VALDHRCEVFSVAKWTSIRTKEVQKKLGKANNLPSVTDTKIQIAKDMSKRLTMLKTRQNEAIQTRFSVINDKKSQMLKVHENNRQALKVKQQTRQTQETQQRQSRYNKGMHGILDRLTGKHTRIKKQNEQETLHAQKRDTQEKDQMIFAQMKQNQNLQNRTDRLQIFQQSKGELLNSNIKQYRDIEAQKRELFELRKSKSKNHNMNLSTHER